MPQPQWMNRALRLIRSRKFQLPASLILLAALGCGGYYGFWRYHLKRFTEVAPGVFYRTAQPTEVGLRHLAENYGVRTVVSLQLFDFRLFRGWLDLGKPDGDRESEYCPKVGLRHVQWPMGDEQCWPWPDPWELQEFFRLVDNPDNRPILIHCMGGRHRTGTMTALYRLEYERRPIDEVLQEMYSYSFGEPIPGQERNLRTYVPRPLPTGAEWPAVAAAFGVDASRSPLDAVPVLAYQIRQDDEAGTLRKTLREQLVAERPFALALASRVVEEVDDPLLTEAIPAARRTLEKCDNSGRDITAATSLIADFGTPADQKLLLDLLESQGRGNAELYEALVCGVTNHYTPNRLAFLKPLLKDRRIRPGQRSRELSYADTAAVRFAAITDELPLLRWTEQQLVQEGPQTATAWLEAHPQEAGFSKLLPPMGRRVALEGDGPREEDLSKMRR